MTEIILVGLTIFVVILLGCYRFDWDDDDMLAYGQLVIKIQFYLVAALFIIIIICLLVVDILLLKRLKIFYPNFYQKEKNKVIS